MIKELLFSGKKWFDLSSIDSDRIVYNGRKYRSYPSRVAFWNDDAIKLTSYGTSSDKGLFKVEDECLGVFDNGITYYIVGNTNRLYLIDKSKTLKVVWGG